MNHGLKTTLMLLIPPSVFRWELVASITRRSEAGLGRMYADRPNWPKDARSPYTIEVWEFVGRMRAAAKK